MKLSKLAILCPGQGSQSETMFDLAFQNKAIKEEVSKWIATAGITLPLETILKNKATLFSNQFAQPLIVASSLANWKALQEKLPNLFPFSALGLSIGEVSAYGIANMLSPSHAVKLACERASVMDATIQTDEAQGLMAVTHLFFDLSVAFLKKYQLTIAIDNRPQSLVLGGFKSDLENAAKQLIEMGSSLYMIPIQIASHTPLMQKAVVPFKKVLKEYEFNNALFPVLSASNAEMITTGEIAKAELVHQLTHTLRWSRCLDILAESGITTVLEIGPGAALSKMMSARHPHISCRSVSDFKSFDGVAEWLAK